MSCWLWRARGGANTIVQVQKLLTPLLAAAALAACGAAWCQTPESQTDERTAAAGSAAAEQPSQLASDIKRYFTAPLHWDRGDWAWFGGALVAIGAAHHYDTQVRTHFVKTLGSTTTTNKDVQDALPTAAVFVATWGYANLIGDTTGRGEAWAMLEAGGLGGVTALALKYAAGREGPDQTSDP